MSSDQESVCVNRIRRAGYQCSVVFPVDDRERLDLRRFDRQDLIYFVCERLIQHMKEEYIAYAYQIQIGKQFLVRQSPVCRYYAVRALTPDR